MATLSTTILKRVFTSVFLGLSVCCHPTQLTGQDASLPLLRRIILISCDTLSARHLPLYGYETVTTTTLDSLAAWGVTFRHCLVPQGWTLTSHMSMLTSLDPGVHRVGKSRALNSRTPYLPEILDSNGYAVAAFLGANQWLDPIYGFGRGFLTYEFLQLGDLTDRWGFRWLKNQLPQKDFPELNKPFFLFFHFMDTHSRPTNEVYSMPYWAVKGIYNHFASAPDIPPPPQLTPDGKQWDMAAYDISLLRRGYDACVRFWDNERLRVVLNFLRSERLLDDTLLIVTSDHGEEIAEHGGYFHDSPYGEVREVPLVIVWLGRLPRDMVIETPVSINDITPTILDLAGLPLPDPCQGQSLRSLWEDPTADHPPRDFLIDGNRRGHSLKPTALVALEAGTWWSLVTTTDTTGTFGTFRPARVDSLIGLFNLQTDPCETHNLLTANPELARGLQRRLEKILATNAILAKQIAADVLGREVEITDEAKKRLRALGY